MSSSDKPTPKLYPLSAVFTKELFNSRLSAWIDHQRKTRPGGFTLPMAATTLGVKLGNLRNWIQRENCPTFDDAVPVMKRLIKDGF